MMVQEFIAIVCETSQIQHFNVFWKESLYGEISGSYVSRKNTAKSPCRKIRYSFPLLKGYKIVLGFFILKC